MDQQLRDIYTDPNDPGSYGGAQRLYQSARTRPGLEKLTLKDVQTFLKNEETYTLHKQIRRRFKRNPTIVGSVDQQWQVDLADLSDIAKHNDGYRYLLTVVDCLSKYAWAVPVRKKDSSALVAAFTTLFRDAAPRKPKRIQSDKGKEFFNAPVQELFAKHKIEHFATENETKASMVERFNRTLKNRMFTYFTDKNTYRYVEVLPKLINSYNRSHHRTIGTRPIDVDKGNQGKIWHKVYGAHAGRVVPISDTGSIVPNSIVRISKAKSIFDKGYLPNWSTEVFRVVKSDSSDPKKQYSLKDMLNEEIKGRFYPEEIQAVKKPTVYKIERILSKRKTRNGSFEHLVKWRGLPTKFNSWVKDKELKRI